MCFSFSPANTNSSKRACSRRNEPRCSHPIHSPVSISPTLMGMSI